MITIPDNVDVFACDVGNFTIWCRQAEQFFTVAPVDLELFVSAWALAIVFQKCLFSGHWFHCIMI